MIEEPADDTPESLTEECLDDMDEFIGSLQRYPDSVIAMSMRIHLAALLRAMLDSEGCSREDVRGFVAALEQEALGPADI